jgi:prepilin-type N-terminal cleavage/methylation domain-containing protein
VFGKTNTGFSFIEIIVAIAIVGVMAAIVIPRLRVRGTSEIDALVNKIAELTQQGYERALVTGKVHRVFFTITTGQPSKAALQVAEDTKPGDELKFVPVPAEYNPTSFEWDERLRIVNFYIRGTDEGSGLKTAWFYILPDGLSQEIVMNIGDEQTPDERGLVLNPFHVKFSVYDSFQKA